MLVAAGCTNSRSEHCFTAPEHPSSKTYRPRTQRQFGAVSGVPFGDVPSVTGAPICGAEMVLPGFYQAQCTLLVITTKPEESPRLRVGSPLKCGRTPIQREINTSVPRRWPAIASIFNAIRNPLVNSARKSARAIVKHRPSSNATTSAVACQFSSRLISPK